MSSTFSFLMLIGVLILVMTPSLDRDVDEDALDSNTYENNEEEEMLWNIELLKHDHRHDHRHRRGRHAPSPRSHGSPRNHRRHAPPPQHHHHALLDILV